MKKRLFIAIDFPPKIKRQIGQMMEELRARYPEIRWEREGNLHLTLKFLGWVDFNIKNKNEKMKPFDSAQGKKLEEILKGMENAVEGIKPFWFQPTIVGFFLRESLIVWLGMEVQEGLFKLVENLEEEMAKIGFSCEKRPFSGHITLGRKRHAVPIGQWRPLAQELENFPALQFEKLKIEKIVLMESRLSPAGSTYIPLAAADLPVKSIGA